MGLLDFLGTGVEDPRFQAANAMAQALMGRGGGMQRLGAGIGGYSSTLDELRNKEALRRLTEARTAETLSQADERKAQALIAAEKLRRSAEQQVFLNKLLTGQLGSQTASGLPSIMPGSANRSVEQNASNYGVVNSSATPQSFLSRLNEDQITALIGNGTLPEKTYDIWKLSKFGEQQPAGGYRQLPNGQRVFLPDPTKGVGFDNGVVSALPGAASSLAGLEGAKTGAQEAAKAPYTLVDYMENGVPKKGRYTDLFPASQPAAPTPQNSGQVSKAQQLADVQGGAAFSSPGVREAVMKNLGLNFSGRGGLQSGPSVTEKAVADVKAKGNDTWWNESYAPVLASGMSANSMLNNIKSARTGLAMFGKTGWGSDLQVAGANILSSLGVPAAEQKATGAAIFEQSASTRLWEVLNTAKGMQTEGDADRAKRTYARLANTPRANQFILDLAEAVAARDALKASWYREAIPIATKENDLRAIDRKWAEREKSIWDMPSMKKWSQ